MGIDGRGRPRLSDEEKRRRGTFQSPYSDEKYAAKDAAKVITGIFLAKVDEPELPLNEIGRKKYFELATMLLDGGKLTTVTRMNCEATASVWQKMHATLESGKPIPAQVTNQYNSMMRDLRVAENAPSIATENQKNKFAAIGNANTVLQTFRLRRSA